MDNKNGDYSTSPNPSSPRLRRDFCEALAKQSTPRLAAGMFFLTQEFDAREGFALPCYPLVPQRRKRKSGGLALAGNKGKQLVNAAVEVIKFLVKAGIKVIEFLLHAGIKVIELLLHAGIERIKAMFHGLKTSVHGLKTSVHFIAQITHFITQIAHFIVRVIEAILNVTRPLIDNFVNKFKGDFLNSGMDNVFHVVNVYQAGNNLSNSYLKRERAMAKMKKLIQWSLIATIMLNISFAAIVQAQEEKSAAKGEKGGKKSWKDKLPNPDPAEAEVNGTKTLEGRVSGAGYNGLAVELSNPKKDEPSEIWFNYVNDLKLSGIQSLADIQEGDTVSVVYKEAEDGRTFLKEIRLLRKKPAEEILVSTETLEETEK